MIDIETMATSTDSVILSIAAVKFDPFADYQATGVTVSDLPVLDIYLDTESQTGRAIDNSVCEWWSQQDPAVIESVFRETGRVQFAPALEQLHKFVWGCGGRIWCQGPQFDISILEHAYRSIGRAYPWPYYQVRDSRTLLDLVEVSRPAPTHNAVDDCWRQIVGVQKTLAALNIKEFVR